MSSTSPYEAYCIFNAVNLHFKTKNYNYFQYNGKTRVSEEGFNLKKDKYAFHKLARKYDAKELPFFLAVNHVFNSNSAWIREFLTDEAIEVYTDWKKRQDSRKYFFNQDMEKLLADGEFANAIRYSESENPRLLDLIYQNEIHLDTLCIIDKYLNLLDSWAKKLGDDFIWSNFKTKTLKYIPFLFSYSYFDVNEYKLILKKHLLPHK